MPHLWVSDKNHPWMPVALTADAFDLNTLAPLAHALADRVDCAQQLQAVMRIGDGAWAVFSGCAGGIYLNGRPLVAGLAVLSDRDEILVSGKTPVFFSAETLATVQEFPGPARPVFCGRCRQPMKSGVASVRCPRCGVWYDQTPDLPCWTYGDKCAFCGHPTALDSGYSWTPED